jgi:predicted RNA-binding protein YlqC (UPF0109 family)
MVEVFKTSVQSHHDAITLKEILLKEFPGIQINFDLEDCDKVLRTEGNNVPASSVIQIVKTEGFNCEILEE